MGNETLSWILGSSAAIIASLIGISAFFIQKWIAAVDEHLEENSGEIKSIQKEISDVKAEQKIQAKSIPEAVGVQLRAIEHRANAGTESIERSFQEIKKSIETQKELPKEIVGKIILIQDKQNDTDKKVETLYNTVKILIDRLKK